MKNLWKVSFARIYSALNRRCPLNVTFSISLVKQMPTNTYKESPIKLTVQSLQSVENTYSILQCCIILEDRFQLMEHQAFLSTLAITIHRIQWWLKLSKMKNGSMEIQGLSVSHGQYIVHGQMRSLYSIYLSKILVIMYSWHHIRYQTYIWRSDQEVLVIQVSWKKASLQSSLMLSWLQMCLYLAAK